MNETRSNRLRFAVEQKPVNSIIHGGEFLPMRMNRTRRLVTVFTLSQTPR